MTDCSVETWFDFSSCEGRGEKLPRWKKKIWTLICCHIGVVFRLPVYRNTATTEQSPDAELVTDDCCLQVCKYHLLQLCLVGLRWKRGSQASPPRLFELRFDCRKTCRSDLSLQQLKIRHLHKTVESWSSQLTYFYCVCCTSRITENYHVKLEKTYIVHELLATIMAK